MPSLNYVYLGGTVCACACVRVVSVVTHHTQILGFCKTPHTWTHCSTNRVSRVFFSPQQAIVKDFHYMYFAMLLFWLTGITMIVVSLLTKPPEPDRVRGVCERACECGV